jgi:polyferredoxin
VFAATGGGYIICQYDPFVPIFRLSGSLPMVLFGVSLLVVGIFVGRPYCRFLCPYGVLLGLAASVSKWRVRITPDTCTQCRLCEEACAFGAIHKSAVDAPPQPRAADKRRLLLLLGLLPVLIAIGIGLGGLAGGALAGKHRTVNLAARIQMEESGAVQDTTDASAAFRAGNNSIEALYAEARALQHRYTVAARWCGAWIGLVIGLKLLSLVIIRKRPDYEADQAHCLSCARCFRACPQELQRLGLPVPEPIKPANG